MGDFIGIVDAGSAGGALTASITSIAGAPGSVSFTPAAQTAVSGATFAFGTDNADAFLAFQVFAKEFNAVNPYTTVKLSPTPG